MHRLLVLTPAEFSRDVRAVRTARAARNAGYDVVAVCGQISGETPVHVDDVRVTRVGRPARINPLWFGASADDRRESLPARELRALFRIARMLIRSFGLWRAAREGERADVVHAHDVDTLPAGYLLARRFRARLVYDAHELYSEFEAPPPRVARWLILVIERSLARRADAVLTVSEAVARELHIRLGLKAQPVAVVNAPARSQYAASESSHEPLRVVYQGGLGPGRDLDDLLAAAQADGIELTIRIRMANPSALRTAVERRGLANRVNVAEPVSPQRAIESLTEFDVGLIFDRPRTRNSDLSVPNKFFEYLMAGLAVVVSDLETLGPLVRTEGVGRTYEARDPQSLRRVLEELAWDPAAVAEMKRRARALALDRLNAETAADTLVAVWSGRVA